MGERTIGKHIFLGEHEGLMVTLERVTFPGDEIELVGYLYRPAEPSGRGVLFIHGYSGTKTAGHRIAVELARRGVTVLVYDQRGSQFGETGGRLTLPEAVFDGGAALAYLKRQVDGDVDIVGYSMGGEFALLVARRWDVERVVVLAAGVGIMKAFRHPIMAKVLDARSRYVDGLSVRDLVKETEEEIVAAAEWLGLPALFVAGERDPVSPPDSVKELADLCGGDFAVVPGDHSDVPESAADVVVKWLFGPASADV